MYIHVVISRSKGNVLCTAAAIFVVSAVYLWLDVSPPQLCRDPQFLPSWCEIRLELHRSSRQSAYCQNSCKSPLEAIQPSQLTQLLWYLSQCNINKNSFLTPPFQHASLHLSYLNCIGWEWKDNSGMWLVTSFNRNTSNISIYMISLLYISELSS